jgi:hypothetical protein
MTQRLKLTIETQEYLTNKICQEISGFIFNTGGKNKLITLHHFLPVEKVLETETNQELSILINSSWSEFLILDPGYINISKYSVYKEIHNRLPKINDELFMELSETRCVMKVFGYEFFPYNNLNTKITIPYIRAGVISGSGDYAGFSGTPVFLNNKLIGVFSKAYSNNKTLLIIPIYVLIRNFEKKDSYHIYKFLNTPNKINAYYVKNNKIYHPTLKIDIPVSTYTLLEGDLDVGATIQNSSGETLFDKMIVDTDQDIMIEYNLIKLDQTTYLITPRLLALLKRLLN